LLLNALHLRRALQGLSSGDPGRRSRDISDTLWEGCSDEPGGEVVNPVAFLVTIRTLKRRTSCRHSSGWSGHYSTAQTTARSSSDGLRIGDYELVLLPCGASTILIPRDRIREPASGNETRAPLSLLLIGSIE
jgi:hypothetical protein